MNLWLLRPKSYNPNPGPGNTDLAQEFPWRTHWDCYFGHVVRAETAQQAREAVPTGDEAGYSNGRLNPWLDGTLVTCEELQADGDAEVIISDFLAG